MADFFDPKKTKDKNAQAEIDRIDQPKPLNEPEIVVHSMPKKYLSNTTGAQKAKSTGLIILIGGVIVVLLAFAFVYYYFIETPTKVIIKEEPTTASTSVDTEETPEPEPEAENPVEVTEEEIPVVEEIPENVETSTPAISTTTPEEEATTTKKIIEIQPKKIVLGEDSDRDGLTDREEAILGTSVITDDSDKDGYKDLEELLKLYNPSGAGKLKENKNIGEYNNRLYDYTLLHPKAWIAKNIGGDDSIIFELSNNQFIQVVVQTNPKRLSIDNWYKEQFSLSTIPGYQIVNKKGWTGVKNEDGLTYYLANPNSNYIFTLNYSLGVENTVYFKSIFNMMINSLQIISE